MYIHILKVVHRGRSRGTRGKVTAYRRKPRMDLG